MKLPNKALVLFADGRKMLFLRNHGDEARIDLRTEAHDEQELLKDSDMKTDQAGSQAQSGGYGRPSMQEADFHSRQRTAGPRMPPSACDCEH